MRARAVLFIFPLLYLRVLFASTQGSAVASIRGGEDFFHEPPTPQKFRLRRAPVVQIFPPTPAPWTPPAAPRQAGSPDFKVTIFTDASLVDGSGAIHTWLKLEGPGKETQYFSFSKGEKLFGLTFVGISEVNTELKDRKCSESFPVRITQQQYNSLAAAFKQFYKKNPKYQLVPSGPPSYNCVTAAHEVLTSAGIDQLKCVVSPDLVRSLIKHWKNPDAVQTLEILKLRDPCSSP